jgi:peptidoglycan/LPS O-acetylase OafA/YrhL
VSSSTRLAELDALRGIAALAVVLFHYTIRYDQLYGHAFQSPHLFYFGHLGVHLFFIISGFVIFWTLSRTKHALDFVVSRFSRLYPCYWVALILTFCVVHFFSLPGREVSMNDALLNIPMIQSYFFIPYVDEVYWSLNVEMTFYAWIFLAYITQQFKRIEWYLIVFIIVEVFFHRYETLAGYPRIAKLLMLNHGYLFAAGICFFKVWQKKASTSTYVALMVSFICIWIYLPLENAVVVAGCYVVFAFMVLNRLKFLNIKPLTFLGSISYPLYLLHQNIGYVLLNLGYQYQLHPFLAIFMVCSLMIIAATIVTFYIEKPLIALVRHSYEKRR